MFNYPLFEWETDVVRGDNNSQLELRSKVMDSLVLHVEDCGLAPVDSRITNLTFKGFNPCLEGDFPLIKSSNNLAPCLPISNFGC